MRPRRAGAGWYHGYLEQARWRGLRRPTGEASPGSDALAHEELASAGHQQVRQPPDVFVSEAPVEVPRVVVEIRHAEVDVRPALKGAELELSHEAPTDTVGV